MNWIRDKIKPGIKKLFWPKDSTPKWSKCALCEQLVFLKKWQSHAYVCPHCSYHAFMPVEERRALMLDTVESLHPLIYDGGDPLGFEDLKTYKKRLKDARHTTQAAEALDISSGSLGGIPVVLAIMNFAFIGGSMGQSVGEGLVHGARLARDKKAAYIIVTASGGARMQEGLFSLMQMTRVSAAIVHYIRSLRLPYIGVLTHPTTGGVAASFPMMADVLCAEPQATLGFTGSRVIEETLRIAMPKDFQYTETHLQNGMIDAIVSRMDLRPYLTNILKLLHPTQRQRR